MRLVKLSLLFYLVIMSYSAAADSIFSIKPTITALTLRSDGHTVVPYIVTNNSSAVLRNITINLSYNTLAHLRMAKNNCSVLNPGESCQFEAIISGSDQPKHFIISPAVCAYNRTACSQPILSHRLTVSIKQIFLPVSAYVGLSNNKLLPITLISNSIGIPNNEITGFAFNEPAGICLSPDGSKVFVTNTGTNEVFVVNSSSQKIIKRFPVGNVPTALAISPNGTFLYVVNYNNGQSQGTISVLNASTGVLQRNIAIGNGPWGIAQNPEGTALYVSNSYDNTISIINTEKWKLLRSIQVGQGPLGIVSAPNNAKIYVANTKSNTVSVINTSNNKVTHIPVGKLPKGLAINPDGTRLYVGNWEDGTISIISTVTNKVIGSIDLNAGPLGLAINPEGTQLYVTLDQVSAVVMINLATTTIQYLPIDAPQVTMGSFIG